MAKITILGSGTSDGIPQLACNCPVCLSPDPRDRRLRASALIQHGATNILIDCGPDFREQALTHGIDHIDAVLCTHHHFDHITGLGELRPLSNAQGSGIAVYASPGTIGHIRERFSYAFNPVKIGGGAPSFCLIPLEARQTIAGIETLSFTVMHGTVPILGFRIGGLVYITDASAVPEASREIARGCRLLIVNALREKPHPTHFCIAEACAFAKGLDAERSYLTHLAHHVQHALYAERLPDGVSLAWDGLSLDFDIPG